MEMRTETAKGRMMNLDTKKSGAWLVRHALEQLPVSHTFGIPGVHNTEIYDELNRSERIHPVLVTHEAGAAFIADAISRTSRKGEIGVLVIVPAAGITHAMSGIGEAYLDGIPMLIISGGTRTDVPYGFQLHDVDQQKLLAAVTKGTWKAKTHQDIVPMIYEAYALAVSGTPGPVFVEIPANIQLLQGEVRGVPEFRDVGLPVFMNDSQIDQAVALLADAKSPGLFVGWGAVDVVDEVQKIAEMLGAPVSTTLQGLSAFPGGHPLYSGMGFGPASIPSSENAFKNCDVMLAIGTRFGEIPTGSFGCKVPENLIHIDINPEAISRNFKAKVGIVGDSRTVVPKLLSKLEARGIRAAERRSAVETQIRRDRESYFAEWADHAKKVDRVSPALFFKELRSQLDSEAIVAIDDGNHTFLAAELFQANGHRNVICPTDFNCMGYCVPAAIGAKLANPNRQVIGIVGDGAFMMTGLEILTATSLNAGLVYFIFADGELSQISQGQEIPYNRKTCTVLGNIKLEGVALATGAKYLPLNDNASIGGVVREALSVAAKGQPVIVDVRIDYSKRTRFTQGVVKTVLKRFPLGDKFRFIGRAVVRKITG